MKSKKKNLKEMIALGSKTAKGGFSNEQDVIDRFNDWEIIELKQSKDGSLKLSWVYKIEIARGFTKFAGKTC